MVPAGNYRSLVLYRPTQAKSREPAYSQAHNLKKSIGRGHHDAESQAGRQSDGYGGHWRIQKFIWGPHHGVDPDFRLKGLIQYISQCATLVISLELGQSL